MIKNPYIRSSLLACMGLVALYCLFTYFPPKFDKPIRNYHHCHTCSDSTHYRCDGECTCDGMYCKTNKP